MIDAQEFANKVMVEQMRLVGLRDTLGEEVYGETFGAAFQNIAKQEGVVLEWASKERIAELTKARKEKARRAKAAREAKVIHDINQ